MPTALLVAFLLVVPPARADVSTAAAGHPAISDGCAHLPSGWRFGAIVAAATRTIRAQTLSSSPTIVAQTRVLAWQREKNERGIVFESSLVWLELADGRFSLAHVFREIDREPLSVDGDGDGWSVAVVYRGQPPFTRRRMYRARPTPKDLDRFTKENFWPFAAHEGDRLLDAEVCTESFSVAFGHPPWRHYAR